MSRAYMIYEISIVFWSDHT